MKLQNLTVIFIIIILPVIILQSAYITNGIKTIKYQAIYDDGLLNATHDAIYAYELNTANDEYSGNAETKRENIKSAIKLFERSLCNTCGISTYDTDEIEDYIPALAFCMYDGFYVYSPSVTPEYSYDTSTHISSPTGNYKLENNLKSYVYYSEQITGSGYDITIRYSLDNYVVVSGKLVDYNGENAEYRVMSGYLIYSDIWKIDELDTDAKAYYDDAVKFTKWFNDNIASHTVYGKIGGRAENGNDSNIVDPEDVNSAFVQHKREIMKNKIESVLNATISAYASRTWGNSFKMPKLSEECWQRIYSDVAMISFFQGKSIGLSEYNGYCVLNSNNSNEYVNPNLLYFVDNEGYYHDIRCSEVNENIRGYKISKFNKVEDEETERNVYQKLKRADGTECIPLACYKCVNGSLGSKTTVYEFVTASETDEKIKKAYWTALARERYIHEQNLID